MSVPDQPPRHKPTLTGPGGPRVDTDRTVGNRGGAMTATNARRVGASCDPALLDPAERMGVDELRALQLERLRATLRHAYENVPLYRAAFDAAGVHPDDCRELADLARFPFTTKADLRDNYPFGMFAVPRSRCAACTRPAVPRAGRPSSATPSGDLDTWADRDGPLDPGGGRAARRHGAHRVRLRPVHRRARRALRRGAAGLHGHPRLRRHDRPAGAADPGLRAARSSW